MTRRALIMLGNFHAKVSCERASSQQQPFQKQNERYNQRHKAQAPTAKDERDGDASAPFQFSSQRMH